MAKTYRWGEVLSLVSRHLPRIVEDAHAPFIVNLAIDEIWEAYDWRESLGSLPPFWLIPSEQDFGTPFYAVPSDFAGLRSADLVFLGSQPAHRTSLGVIQDLQRTNERRTPESIGFDRATSKIRVYPRVPEGMGSPLYLIDGVYKKVPTKLTAQNMASTLVPFEDKYISVLIEAVKWAGWSITGDPRAGGVQISGGQKFYTGQYATLKEKIEWMADKEGMISGGPAIAPAEPLANFGWSHRGY